MKRLLLVPVLLAIALGAAAAPAPQKSTAKAPAKTAATPAATTPAPAEVDSLALLEKAVAKDSTKIENLYRLGVMYIDRDRPADAVTVLGKAYEKRPKDMKLLVNLGAAHDALGHGEIAQDLYQRALAIAPGDSVASCRLASSYYVSGKQQQCVDILRGVIQRTPAAYCAYFQMGVAFADAGIYRDAIRMWQRVVELAPTSPEALSAQESITVLQKFVQ